MVNIITVSVIRIRSPHLLLFSLFFPVTVNINVNLLHRDLGGILLHILASILTSVVLIVLFRPLIALVKFFDQTNYNDNKIISS